MQDFSLGCRGSLVEMSRGCAPQGTGEKENYEETEDEAGAHRMCAYIGEDVYNLT